MSSISARLAQRSVKQHSAAAQQRLLSLESSIVEGFEETGAGIDEMREDQGQITEAAGDIATSTTGANSLSDLVDKTVEIYQETGIPEDAARQMEVSVEAILRVMGHPGGFQSVLPSFEHYMDPKNYSAEAEEKKNGVIQRIWAMLVKIFDRIKEIGKNLINRIRNSSDKLEKLTGDLETKINGLSGATPEGNVALGANGRLVGADPINALNETYRLSESYIKNLSEFFEAIIKPQLDKKFAKSDPAQITAFFEGIDAHGQKLPGWQKKAVTAFHSVEITGGADKEYPGLGAKIKFYVDKPNESKEFKHLSIPEMKSLLGACKHLVAELKENTKEFDRWISNLDMFKEMGKGASRSGTTLKMFGPNDSKEAAAGLMKQGQSIQGMATIGIDGLSQVFPTVMEIVRANLTYVNKSAASYGKSEAAEKPAATDKKD